MSFNAPFPPYPSIGELVTYQGSAYRWDGEYWWPYGTSSGYVLTGNSLGSGISLFRDATGNTINFKSFSGNGINITDTGSVIVFSGSGGSGPVPFSNIYIEFIGNGISIDPQNKLDTSFTFNLDVTGGTITGSTNFTNGLTANTFSATTYRNLPVSGLTAGSNIGLTNNNGNYTISFTGTTGSNFTGGTVTGATNFTGGITATTISATTIFADNIQETLYRLPSSVALPVSTTTTAATISIPRTSVFSAQTLKVEGIFVGQQPTAANKTIQCFWNNGANPQGATVATTSNTGSFGFLARITQGGVFFSRNAIYAASNQGSNSYSDVGGNILIRVEINPSTSAATLEHLVVTLY